MVVIIGVAGAARFRQWPSGVAQRGQGAKAVVAVLTGDS